MHESVNNSTFGNEKSEAKIVKKTKTNGTVCLSALVVPLICLPISSQPVNFEKEQFAEVRDFGQMNVNDLLIGSEFYWGLVTGEVKRGKQEGLVV